MILPKKPISTSKITWEVHPAIEHPMKAAVALLLIGIILGGIYGFCGDFILCAIGLVVFLVTLAPFFHRTRYEMDETGITRWLLGSKRALRWSQIKRYTISDRGVFISKGIVV